MPTKRPRQVLHWDDERRLGHSLIITLRPGFAFYPHSDENVASHVDGFDTVKEAEAAARAAKCCGCARCRRGKD